MRLHEAGRSGRAGRAKRAHLGAHSALKRCEEACSRSSAPCGSGSTRACRRPDARVVHGAGEGGGETQSRAPEAARSTIARNLMFGAPSLHGSARRFDWAVRDGPVGRAAGRRSMRQGPASTARGARSRGPAASAAPSTRWGAQSDGARMRTRRGRQNTRRTRFVRTAMEKSPTARRVGSGAVPACG